VGLAEPDGPTLGLAELFLIQIEDLPALRFPRLAGDECAGDGAAAGRRSREPTRVHSLASITCSTKVVGANTGILIPGQLGFRGGAGGGLDDAGLVEGISSDTTSHDVQESVLPHSRSSACWLTFLRHCLIPRTSAEELSERFEQRETGLEREGDEPWRASVADPDRDSPAGSAAGEVGSQNRPGRHPNVSPLIAPRNLKFKIY
jgi:hypothetical protein